jgi:hypothetical protein
MYKRLMLVFAILSLYTVAFAQNLADDYPTQVGYAANLNIGDSVVNLANTGYFALSTLPTGTFGNMCVNVYVFDPQEEEISCCACLVTPFGVNSLSVKNDLISDTLTPVTPTSVSIYLISSPAGVDPSNNYTICDPTFQNPNTLQGMVAWGTTLVPANSPGTYVPIDVPFKGFAENDSATGYLPQLCGFIQSNGSGFGVCNSCRTGALSGSKH